MFSSPIGNKHIACTRCRERKVKCDGLKPSCRRCQRNGHACAYLRGKKQRPKNEWLQHLRTFSAQPMHFDTTGASTKQFARSSIGPERDIAPGVIVNESMPNPTRAPSVTDSYASNPTPSNHIPQWMPDTISTEQAASSPHPYAIMQGATFQPASEDANFSLAPWRSTTPFSQASEDSMTMFPSTTSNPTIRSNPDMDTNYNSDSEGLDPRVAWPPRSYTPFSLVSEDVPLDGVGMGLLDLWGG
ncbi:hypothetical protein K491DRAFT_677172 [Lophiostoma macrostomum CBS 122681]|uniref:Zn(2)-C6 fungal-type domain-containing protein n=1 Tax=Lophiostoma macrostomum CBS 122681 TaxID=1314788 RepID=A0A6A6TCZ2_9PLEO|nr:hypothetical protein K491DRAFT_677172 [Lophiostoma macrostomum CBS 122681]